MTAIDVTFILFYFIIYNVYILHSQARNHTLYLHYIVKLEIKNEVVTSIKCRCNMDKKEKNIYMDKKEEKKN
jgi:hypothetical protein